MRALLLAVLLFALPAQASYLAFKTYCGEIVYVTGTVDDVTIEATPDMIKGNSDLTAFYRKVMAGLRVVDGKPQYVVIPLERVLGKTCPVSI